MRILITGAAGFIGQLLAEKLLNDEDGRYSLTLTDVIKPPIPSNVKWPEKAKSVVADLCTDASLVVDKALDAVFVFHGIMSSGAELDFELGMKVNFDATRILLDTLRKSCPGVRVIYAWLEDTLKINDKQYQTAVMVLWAGYISMMVPSNMLLSVFKPRLYLPTVVIVWGIVSGATGFVQNHTGLVVLRFLVGVTEAPYFVGCIFLLSCWYTKQELPGRIAIFYSGYTLSSAFGGLIAAGIVDGMDGLGSYPSWRWVFILEGALTIVVAILGYFLLPNYPSNTPWLSEEERAMAQYRLSREADGEADEVTESVFVGLKQALCDPKVYLLIFIQSAAVVSMSFTYFFPSTVKTLGYGRVETLFMTAPPYFAAFLFSLANSWHSGKTNERCFHIVGACCISACGQIISMSTHVLGARYFAMFLQAMGSFSAFQIILSWVSSTIPRPKAKRGIALALASAISNATNISTAYLYPSWNAPLYRMGCIVLTVALLCCATASLVLRFWLKKLNQKADRATGLEGVDNGTGLLFRYVL